MKKVTWLIVLVGILMTLGLVKVIFKGVRLEERQMVKWSQVESADQAGHKMGRFLFPLIQEKKKVFLSGDTVFSQEFFLALQKEALMNNATAEIVLDKNQEHPENFHLSVLALEKEVDSQGCDQGDALLCSEFKAARLLKKKNPPKASLWITMYRLGEGQAVLFYKQ